MERFASLGSSWFLTWSYLENLGEQGVTVEDLESGEIEWEDLALKLRRRLLSAVRSE